MGGNGPKRAGGKNLAQEQLEADWSGAPSPYVPCPPTPERVAPKLIVVKLGRKWRGAVVAERVLGLYQHWAEGRTRPCLAAWMKCGCCESGIPRMWYGYLACMELPSRIDRVLTIPAAAYRCCSTLVQQNGRLRGWGIEAERIGDNQNAPVRMTLGPLRVDVLLREGFNPAPSLLRVAGIGQDTLIGKLFMRDGEMALVRDEGTSAAGVGRAER